MIPYSKKKTHYILGGVSLSSFTPLNQEQNKEATPPSHTVGLYGGYPQFFVAYFPSNLNYPISSQQRKYCLRACKELGFIISHKFELEQFPGTFLCLISLLKIAFPSVQEIPLQGEDSPDTLPTHFIIQVSSTANWQLNNLALPVPCDVTHCFPSPPFPI